MENYNESKCEQINSGKNNSDCWSRFYPIKEEIKFTSTFTILFKCDIDILNYSLSFPCPCFMIIGFLMISYTSISIVFAHHEFLSWIHYQFLLEIRVFHMKCQTLNLHCHFALRCVAFFLICLIVQLRVCPTSTFWLPIHMFLILPKNLKTCNDIPILNVTFNC